MRRGSLQSALAVMVIAGVSACGVPAPNDSSAPTQSPTQTPAVIDTVATVEFFFAHSQPTRLTLIGETQRFAYVDDLLRSALAALIDGRVQPLDPDYATLWGSPSALRSLSRDGDILTIDLQTVALTVGAEGESMAIAQLVWTAMSIDPTIGAVAFTVAGLPVETLAGHVDVTALVGRGAPESILTPVQIVSIADGSRTTNPVRVTGVACVFEATVNWRLRSPSGEETAGFTMASEACPVRAPWVLELGALEPGEYLLTVEEYSMKDGSVTSSDSKRFVVE